MRAFDQTEMRSISHWLGARRPSACGTPSIPGAVSCGATAVLPRRIRFLLQLSGRAASERVLGRSTAASPVSAGEVHLPPPLPRRAKRRAPGAFEAAGPSNPEGALVATRRARRARRATASSSFPPGASPWEKEETRSVLLAVLRRQSPQQPFLNIVRIFVEYSPTFSNIRRTIRK